VQIASGASHTCAALDNGESKCWGRNDRGQLGQGSKGDGITYDVTYTSGTELLQGSAADALTNVDPSTGTYTFDASALASAGVSLEAGEILFIEDTALRRIDSVTENGATISVATSDATLTDAIADGAIAWDFEADYSAFEEASLVVQNGEKSVSCLPSIDPQTQEISFECTIDDYTITLSVTPTLGNQGINTVNFTYQVEHQTSGSTDATMTGTGTVKGITSTGKATYSGQSLQTFEHEQKDIQIDGNISLNVAGAYEASGLDFPTTMLFRIPFTVGPIPMSVDIGIDFGATLQAEASAQAQAQAEVTFSYNGTTGFQYGGTDVSTSASLNSYEFKDGNFDASAVPGIPVSAGFGLAFPRVGLSVLTQQVAYVQTQFTAGASLTWGPICKSGYAQLEVVAGYEIEILGVPISKDAAVLAQKRRDAECGSAPATFTSAGSAPVARNQAQVPIPALAFGTESPQNTPPVVGWAKNSADDVDALGDQSGEMGENLSAIVLGGSATALVPGKKHTCAIISREVKCWGANTSGALGTGDSQDRGDEPGEMGSSLGFIDLGTGSSVLPVELAAFEAYIRDEHVHLRWSTLSETDNAGFHVERQLNQEWSRVGFVAGAGTTQRTQYYRFDDQTLPFETVRASYRLRQVDVDGGETLSAPIHVVRPRSSQIQFDAPFPNPARTQVTLRYELPIASPLRIEIFDLLGRVVQVTESSSQEAGRAELQVDISELASGTYFVRFSTGAVVQTQRFVVLR